MRMYLNYGIISTVPYEQQKNIQTNNLISENIIIIFPSV